MCDETNKYDHYMIFIDFDPTRENIIQLRNIINENIEKNLTNTFIDKNIQICNYIINIIFYGCFIENHKMNILRNLQIIMIEFDKEFKELIKFYHNYDNSDINNLNNLNDVINKFTDSIYELINHLIDQIRNTSKISKQISGLNKHIYKFIEDNLSYLIDWLYNIEINIKNSKPYIYEIILIHKFCHNLKENRNFKYIINYLLNHGNHLTSYENNLMKNIFQKIKYKFIFIILDMCNTSNILYHSITYNDPNNTMNFDKYSISINIQDNEIKGINSINIYDTCILNTVTYKYTFKHDYLFDIIVDKYTPYALLNWYNHFIKESTKDITKYSIYGFYRIPNLTKEARDVKYINRINFIYMFYYKLMNKFNNTNFKLSNIHSGTKIVNEIFIHPDILIAHYNSDMFSLIIKNKTDMMDTKQYNKKMRKNIIHRSVTLYNMITYEYNINLINLLLYEKCQISVPYELWEIIIGYFSDDYIYINDHNN